MNDLCELWINDDGKMMAITQPKKKKTDHFDSNIMAIFILMTFLVQYLESNKTRSLWYMPHNCYSQSYWPFIQRTILFNESMMMIIYNNDSINQSINKQIKSYYNTWMLVWLLFWKFFLFFIISTEILLTFEQKNKIWWWSTILSQPPTHRCWNSHFQT